MFECNKTEFAAIVGKSRAYVDILAEMGVINVGRCNEVFLNRSLYQYFFDFLYHSENRDNEFLAAVQRISKLKIKKSRRRKNITLFSCRRLLPLIRSAELKISVLKSLKRFGGQFPSMFIINSEKELDNLHEQFLKAKLELQQKILAAKMPVAAETIALARYCYCDSWNDIAEGFSISLSTCYRLHRQALIFFTKRQKNDF